MKSRTKRVSAAPAPAMPKADIGTFRAQHLSLAERVINTGHGERTVTMDEGESPLAWLARRRGRDGRAMVAPHQLQAGERLRADFTRAHMMPRTTSDWSGSMSSGRRGGGGGGTTNNTRDDRVAPAGQSGARRGRPRILRPAARPLLLSQRLGRSRA